MADLGADVIKIESPEGDDTRIWRPLFIERGGDKAAAYFHGANKGKTSVAIDLKDPEDLARLKSMITGEPIFWSKTSKSGGLTKFGLDFDRLHAAHPACVYC